ncbi:DUF899 domain-containing protein [Nocardia sp. SYP-A9097]|nr:DUF899 domain-containing protein [Nocardia sp. SYP-A9097]
MSQALSWKVLIGREEVLVQDRASTRTRDAHESQRRKLPMIKLDKGYDFGGPDGPVTLLDLFLGLRRLGLPLPARSRQRGGMCELQCCGRRSFGRSAHPPAAP